MKNETALTVETAVSALKELIQRRTAAAERLQKIDRKIEELEQPDPNLELLKSRKAELFGLREDILACGLLGEKPTRGGLTLAEVNQESAAIDKKIAELAEQLVTRRMQASGLSRRRIDASTELQGIDRQISGAVRDYLQARSEVALLRYEAAAEVVRAAYPEVRGLGVWLASLSGSKLPFLEDTNRLAGGPYPVVPFGHDLDRLVSAGAHDVGNELKRLLPEDLQLAAPIYR